MGIESWSTTAGSNNSSPPNGAPEGMAPSTVNNVIRENMAGVRSWYEEAQWINHGDTIAYASGTSFTITGVDRTSIYHTDRRIKAVGSSTGTIYGSISSSSFSTNTTVNVTWDSGSLQNEALTIYYGAVSATNTSVPSAGGSAYTDPLTTRGDLVVRGASSTTRKAIGSANTILYSDGTDPQYGNVTTAMLSSTILNGLTAITTLQDVDQFPLADNSDSDNNKKITFANLAKALINGLSAITTLQDADQFAFADNSNSDASAKITFANLSKALINGLSAVTTLENADQFPLADNSASDASKKITYANLITALNSDLTFPDDPGLVLLSEGTASSAAAITITSGIDSTYDEYIIKLFNVAPGTTNQPLVLQTSTNGGSSYNSGASDYAWAVKGVSTGGTDLDANDSADSSIEIAHNMATTTGVGGAFIIHLADPAATSQYKTLGFTSRYWAGGDGHSVVTGIGRRLTTADIDALQILFASGTISAKYKVYGVRKS